MACITVVAKSAVDLALASSSLLRDRAIMLLNEGCQSMEVRMKSKSDVISTKTSWDKYDTNASRPFCQLQRVLISSL
jgi:hypothetical protein